MQKVIRRTLFAEKQAARRLAKRKQKEAWQWETKNRTEARRARHDEIGLMRAAQAARQEDWELGPLAPRRDVGDNKDTYGTVDQSHLRLKEIAPDKIHEALKSVGGKFLHLAKGDRVVLLEGRDKGKIGKIMEINKSRASCTVEGLNKVDIAIPKWMRDMDKDNSATVRSMEAPVLLTSVRLVYPLTDTETGQTKDVIVKKLVSTSFFYNKETGRSSWTRVIPGLNVEVPWPKVQPPELKDYDVDTLRMDVESRTFVPTLLRPPMPSTVIDELRNKFSKFRTRHDPEYIEAKMQEDRDAEAEKKRIAEMRTPLNEINRKERKLKRAKGKGVLTPDMLENLGKVMARNRQLAIGPAEPSATSIEGSTLEA